MRTLWMCRSIGVAFPDSVTVIVRLQKKGLQTAVDHNNITVITNDKISYENKQFCLIYLLCYNIHLVR